MSKYIRKPAVIDAMQYLENERDACIKFCGDYVRHSGIDEEGAGYETLNLFLKTQAGEMMIRPGDWIVKSLQGEIFPVNKESFEANYEPSHE